MTNDTFEDELRSLLRDTADAEGPAYVDVDPHAVVTRGRRVVRRRRMAAGAGIAAAVLAIGAGGALVNGVGQDRTDTTVPAGPTTGLGSGSFSVDLDVSSALQGTITPLPNDPTSVRVDVNQQTKKWQVTVTGSDGRPTMRPAATLPANPRFSTYAEVGNRPGLIVGLMPLAAKDIVPVWATDPVESSVSSALVMGADRRAFAIRYSAAPDPNVPGDTIFAGFAWTDGEKVFTSAGTSVPSARLLDSVAFVDETQGLFGLFGPKTTASKRLIDPPEGKLPGLVTGKLPINSATMQTSVLVLLPAGAKGVDVSASSGATVHNIDTAPAGSVGRTMVMVRLTTPKDTPGSGVERLRWINADGSAGSGTIG